MTARRRGEVVWHPAPFADYDRPFLVVSTAPHPVHGEEYVALAISTTGSERAIPIEPDDWTIGDLPRESHVKPWIPAVLKGADITGTAGALREETVDRAVDALAGICGR